MKLVGTKKIVCDHVLVRFILVNSFTDVDSEL